DTDWAAGACRHRPRQYRTVFGHTSSSRALSRTPILSAACKIMRARNANCCEVEWARTSASSASRCAGKTITGSAASQGISASDSSCHGAADSTPVLLPESSLAHTTLVPPRKAESQLPLGGTSCLVTHAHHDGLKSAILFYVSRS